MKTFPTSVLRTRTFHPQKFEGNLAGAIEVMPSSCEYMYLNGIVWYVPLDSRKVESAVDTGLRFKDIVQDAKENKALEHIKALME